MREADRPTEPEKITEIQASFPEEQSPEKPGEMKPQGTQLNPWQYKPWWCQPWSIVLTGMGAIVGSWLLFHRYWFTAGVAGPVLAWMGLFLIIWPRVMIEQGEGKDLGGKDNGRSD